MGEMKFNPEITFTVRNVSKYGVFSGLYHPVFISSAGKYGPEKTPYLDTFHAVILSIIISLNLIFKKGCCLLHKIDVEYTFSFLYNRI